MELEIQSGFAFVHLTQMSQNKFSRTKKKFLFMTQLKNHIFNVIYLAWRFLSSCSCTYPDKILIDMLATLVLAGSDTVKGCWNAQGILNPQLKNTDKVSSNLSFSFGIGPKPK